MVFGVSQRGDPERYAMTRIPKSVMDRECPECSHSDTSPISRRRRPDYWFSITAPRKCANCKALFVPKASVVHRVITLSFGGLLTGLAIAFYLIPAIVGLGAAGWTARRLLNGLLGAITVVFGAYLIVTAVRSGRSRRFPTDSPAPSWVGDNSLAKP
jgi:hypothetical protein